jgi:hypothetical protein
MAWAPLLRNGGDLRDIQSHGHVKYTITPLRDGQRPLENLDALAWGLSLNIGGRAISALIQAQGIRDLDRIYLTAQQVGYPWHKAARPAALQSARRTCSNHGDLSAPRVRGKNVRGWKISTIIPVAARRWKA